MQDDKQGKCMIYGSQDAIDRAIVMQQHQDAQGLAANVCDAARQQGGVYVFNTGTVTWHNTPTRHLDAGLA